MSPEILLQTERLYFRRLTSEDVGLLFELDSDPETMRFISKGEPTPLDGVENVIMLRVRVYYLSWPPQGFWIAHLRDTKEFVGWFHLRPDKITPDEMELGYRLKRNVWGRGLATEASRALVERGFGEWGYPKISGRTLPINLASRRVLEKAGLQFEADFIWNEDALPGWTAEERKGVKYAARRQTRS